MGNNFVFSWAEDAQGKMVHVDDVPRGLACGCVCPCCREKLLARHGDIKEHGFAHHSDNRGANLDICYRVVLYKPEFGISDCRFSCYARFPIGAYYICPPNNMDGKMQEL